MYPEYVKEVEALGQNLFAELQEKAAKWAENEPNINEWIREKCRQFGFEVESEDEDQKWDLQRHLHQYSQQHLQKRLLTRLSDVQILQIKIRIFQPENQKS